MFRTNQPLVIATHNLGKLREFATLLTPFCEKVVSAGELGLPAPEENGHTFVENALIKARAAATASRFVAVADDSGLCVEALGGQPGIYSARWGEGGNFTPAMQRIVRELSKGACRAAHFICVLALAFPDGHTEWVEGRIDGVIADDLRGTNGHGYDPIFIPEGQNQTFAEMDDATKNAFSHRSRATKKLLEQFFAGRAA